jgi:hypothetical protein
MFSINARHRQQRQYVHHIAGIESGVLSNDVPKEAINITADVYGILSGFGVQ